VILRSSFRRQQVDMPNHCSSNNCFPLPNIGSGLKKRFANSHNTFPTKPYKRRNLCVFPGFDGVVNNPAEDLPKDRESCNESLQ
jgi:hypothetical protein